MLPYRRARCAQTRSYPNSPLQIRPPRIKLFTQPPGFHPTTPRRYARGTSRKGAPVTHETDPQPAANQAGPPASSPFIFDLNVKRHRISDEDIIAGLKRFGQALRGRPLTARELGLWKDRPFTATVVCHRFGWRKGLELAGLRSTRIPRYSAEELMNSSAGDNARTPAHS